MLRCSVWTERLLFSRITWEAKKSQNEAVDRLYEFTDRFTSLPFALFNVIQLILYILPYIKSTCFKSKQFAFKCAS